MLYERVAVHSDVMPTPACSVTTPGEHRLGGPDDAMSELWQHFEAAIRLEAVASDLFDEASDRFDAQRPPKPDILRRTAGVPWLIVVERRGPYWLDDEIAQARAFSGAGYFTPSARERVLREAAAVVAAHEKWLADCATLAVEVGLRNAEARHERAEFLRDEIGRTIIRAQPQTLRGLALKARVIDVQGFEPDKMILVHDVMRVAGVQPFALLQGDAPAPLPMAAE